jgi:membrane protease YdiL (CAAX protease family)
MRNNIITRIILFHVLAIVISNLFRFDVLGSRAVILELPAWLSIICLVLLEGGGVLIGALTAIYLMRQKRSASMSLLGTSRTKGLLLLIIPVITLSIVGINNSYGISPELYGFIAGSGSFIYCIFEEYGWRGYLQDELNGLKSWKRYLLIGSL